MPPTVILFAGNEADAVEDRGTVLLVVDESQLDTTRPGGVTLQPEIDRLKLDLIGDGYRVKQINVARFDIPRTNPASSDSTVIAAHFAGYKAAIASTKAAIRNEYIDSQDLTHIILLGHIPVPYSGVTARDGHSPSAPPDHRGAWPADVYYGVMDSESVWTDTRLAPNTSWAENYNWPGDGKFDDDILPPGVDADIAVSRIDFFDLERFGANDSGTNAATVSETNLLKQYLNKNHAYRTGSIDVLQEARYQSQFSGDNYEQTAQLLGPSVGIANVNATTYASGAVPEGTSLGDAIFWGHLDAGGSVVNNPPIERLGNPTVLLTDVSFASNNDYRYVINNLFGSYVGDWDKTNSLLRSSLADEGYGLATVWGSRPTWFWHGVGLGESLGQTVLQANNNNSAYSVSSGAAMLFQRGTHISLLGDATIRQHVVRPVSGVKVSTHQVGTTASSGVTTRIEWNASPDAGVSGYSIYRSDALDGPYSLLNSVPVAGTSFEDITANPNGETYYMVRARKLEATPSGSYWNLSTGQIATRSINVSTFSWNEPPQSFAFQFTRNVESALTTANFSISGEKWDHEEGVFAPVTFVAGTDFELVDYIDDVATVHFLRESEFGVANTLPSGRYTISVEVQVESDYGHSMLSSHTQDVLFVAGDTNNDGIVNFHDLLVLTQHYGLSNPGWLNSFGLGDFDNDDDVDFDDLLILSQYYGLDLN